MVKACKPITIVPLCRRAGHCALCGARFTATNPEGPLQLGGQQYGTCLDCARMVHESRLRAGVAP